MQFHIAQILIVCQSRCLSIAIIQVDDILGRGLHRARLYRIPATTVTFLSGPACSAREQRHRCEHPDKDSSLGAFEQEFLQTE